MIKREGKSNLRREGDMRIGDLLEYFVTTGKIRKTDC